MPAIKRFAQSTAATTLTRCRLAQIHPPAWASILKRLSSSAHIMTELRDVAENVMRLRRGSIFIVGAWICIALLAAALGWHLLQQQLERELRQAEEAAMQDASVVARAYAQNLFRSLEAIDQLSL